MTRTELEQDCDFLGLIIMQVKLMQEMMTTTTPNLSQNLLKKETFGAIAELHQVRSSTCFSSMSVLAPKCPKLAKKIKV